MSGDISPRRKVDFSGAPIYYWVGIPEPGESEDEVFISKVKEVEPPGFLLVSDSESELGSEAYHSLLVGGSVGVVGEYRGRKSFFGPVVSCYKVVVDKVSHCSRIYECLGVGDFS